MIQFDMPLTTPEHILWAVLRHAQSAEVGCRRVDDGNGGVRRWVGETGGKGFVSLAREKPVVSGVQAGGDIVDISAATTLAFTTQEGSTRSLRMVTGQVGEVTEAYDWQSWPEGNKAGLVVMIGTRERIRITGPTTLASVEINGRNGRVAGWSGSEPTGIEDTGKLVEIFLNQFGQILADVPKNRGS